MRRKRLQHFADVLCHMFVGWRMYDDLERLAGLPNGRLSLDLLSMKAKHSIWGDLNLHITEEMNSWLIHQCEKDGLDFAKLLQASLEVDITSQKIVTKRKWVIDFSFDCHSTIKTDEKVYSSRLAEAHTWHRRAAT